MKKSKKIIGGVIGTLAIATTSITFAIYNSHLSKPHIKKSQSFKPLNFDTTSSVPTNTNPTYNGLVWNMNCKLQK